VKAGPLAVLVALGSVWGASFLFIKVLVDEATPMEVVTGRLVLGAVAVALIMAWSGRSFRRRPSTLARLAFMAVIANIVPFALISWAEEHIDSGIASVLNSTMPLWTALFAAALLVEERFTFSRVAGLSCGFAGVAVLGGSDIVDLTDSGVLGEIAVVGGAMCYGVGAVYARVLLRNDDPATLSGLQLLIAASLSVPVLFAFDGVPAFDLSVKAWLALTALGVLGTGVGYVAYLWLVDTLGSVRGSLVVYVTPAVGLFLGWAVLDESIGWNTLVGTALIIVGVAAVMQGQVPGPQRLPLPAAAGE
jgi:drug/metabolite transporter (DMT)-like permease